jgi:hypothetical protein
MAIFLLGGLSTAQHESGPMWNASPFEIGVFDSHQPMRLTIFWQKGL